MSLYNIMPHILLLWLYICAVYIVVGYFLSYVHKVDTISAVQTFNINDYDNEITSSMCPLICILHLLHYIHTGCTKYFVLGHAGNAMGTKEYNIGYWLGSKFIL